MSDEPLTGEIVTDPRDARDGELIQFARGGPARKVSHGGAGPRLEVLPDPPWDRAQGESVRNHIAFTEFLSLGVGRTVRGYAEKIGQKRQRWHTLSARFRWHERADLYDAEQLRLRRVAEEKARNEMAERHAQIAMGLQQRALARLAQIRPETLDARDVARFLDVATRLERLARGEPTEITENEHRHGIRALSNDELDAFERGA